MARHSLAPRKKRIMSPIAWLMLTILVAVALYNLVPVVAGFMQSDENSETGAATLQSTEFVQAEFTIPAQTRAGVCGEPSEFVARTDALRCQVDSAIFDPCFIIPAPINESSTVVCGVDASSGTAGFAIEPKLAPVPVQPVLPTINMGDLGWLRYPMDLVGDTVGLVNDQYYFPAVEAVGGSMLVALSKMRAQGDLDGDGDQDVAVLLVADSDDDRMFIYLSAVLNQNGNAVPAGSILLGDRVNVDHMEIRNGQIVVNMTTHTTDDPACCPTLDVTWRYSLQGTRLVHAVDGWRVELRGGIQCVPVQAVAQAAEPASALPFVYQCTDGTFLRNGLFPGVIWHAQYAGDSALGAADARYAPIVRLWQ